MPQALVTETIPLITDATGVIRVGSTRVPLETVLAAFDTGATPEEIAQDFPVLRLDDIYAVITYCLRHQEEIRDYLDRRNQQAHEVRTRVAQRFDQTGLRERLLARLRRQG